MEKKEKTPKCYGLDIAPELECTPEMKDLCEQEDKVRCNGHGNQEAKPKMTFFTDSYKWLKRMGLIEDNGKEKEES